MTHDILTIEDLPCETRVFLELRRKRIDLNNRVTLNKIMTNPDMAHAVAWRQERLAITTLEEPA